MTCVSWSTVTLTSLIPDLEIGILVPARRQQGRQSRRPESSWLAGYEESVCSEVRGALVYVDFVLFSFFGVLWTSLIFVICRCRTGALADAWLRVSQVACVNL